jgi:uncharacterized protein with NRDE domain
VCTLIVAHRWFAEHPLVIAANRDEALDRPAAPFMLTEHRGVRVLAPRDLTAGGTWLGLNQHRVFAAITNRFFAPRRSQAPSRGRLVLEALAAESAREALLGLRGLDAEVENGFHLLVADAVSAHLLVGDGARLEVRDLLPGVSVITERSFGPPEATAREGLLAEALPQALLGPRPELERLGALLARHAEPSFDGVCVHLDERRYGTRSSTLLTLDARGRIDLVFADGPPCTTPHRDQAALVEALFATGPHVGGG